MALGGLALGSLILYLKGMRTTMFQLSGFYCNGVRLKVLRDLEKFYAQRTQYPLIKEYGLNYIGFGTPRTKMV